MKNRNPANDDNWILICAFPHCHDTFDPEATVGVLAAHWNSHVPDGAEEDKPQLDLKWVGIGPAPKARS